jgi:hypothetical protein
MPSFKWVTQAEQIVDNLSIIRGKHIQGRLHFFKPSG